MNIYELLEEIVVVKKHHLSPQIYTDEAKEKLESDIDKQLFDLLKNISSLGTKITKDGIEFHPFIVWEGKRSFAIEDMSDKDYTLLSSVELLKVPLNLRARIADVLWTQRKEFRGAEVAAKTYLELFNLLFNDDEWVGTLDMIRRAICISAQIKKQELYNECCQTLYDHILRINGKDEHFLSLSLIEIVLQQSFGDMDAILQVLNTIINDDRANVHKIERAYSLKIKCLGIKKDRKAVKNANMELAAYYVNTAEKIINSSIQGAMQAEHFFQKAVVIYRNNGESGKGEKVHRRLVEVQKEIPKLMIPHTTSVDVSKINANIQLNMEGLSFAECVIRITQMITFYKKDDIKKQLFEDIQNHPLSHFFGKNVVNEYGQTILSLSPLDWENPEKDQTLLDMHIFQKMLETQRIIGDFFIKYALFYIREIHAFKLEDLDFLIKDNPIIPSGRERIFRSALYMILKGQYYEGIHILAPQVENLFRNIAKEAGGLTVTLENDGTSKEKVLSSIFDLPELLDCYDNDILFLFKGLLNEQSGANIRNVLAHGILDEGSAGSGVCLYFVCAVIKLLSYTSLACYELIKSNEKLRIYVEPEDDAIELKEVDEDIG